MACYYLLADVHTHVVYYLAVSIGGIEFQDPQMSLETPNGGGENSYSSMASCSTGSSTSSANSNSSSVSSRLSARSVKESWKKFKSTIFSGRSSRGNSSNIGMSGTASCNDFNEGVSTA